MGISVNGDMRENKTDQQAASEPVSSEVCRREAAGEPAGSEICHRAAYGEPVSSEVCCQKAAGEVVGLESVDQEAAAERSRPGAGFFRYLFLFLFAAPAIGRWNIGKYLVNALYFGLLAACARADRQRQWIPEGWLGGILCTGLLRTVLMSSGVSDETIFCAERNMDLSGFLRSIAFHAALRHAILDTAVPGILLPFALFLPLYLCRKGRGFGGADIRYLAAAGAGLGPRHILEAAMTGLLLSLAGRLLLKICPLCLRLFARPKLLKGISPFHSSAAGRKQHSGEQLSRSRLSSYSSAASRKQPARDDALRQEFPLLPYLCAGIFLVALRQFIAGIFQEIP